MSNNVKKYSFQPGAMSIIQMGEELIGHSSTAVNELVKNGYDADAIECKVYFHYDVEKERTFSFVFDNGSGMGKETLFGDWLRPSVSAKRKPGSRSEIYKRHFLGSKGVGRLAAMALGEFVTVISKTKKDKEYNWVTISREAFKEDKLLEEISFPGGTIDKFYHLFEDENLLDIRGCSINLVLSELLKKNGLSDFENGTLLIIEWADESVRKILFEDFKNGQANIFEDDSLSKTEFYKSLATLITPLKLNSEIQNELLNKKIISTEKNLAEKGSEFKVWFGTNLLDEQSNDKIEWQEIKSVPIHSVFDYRVFGKVKTDGAVDGYFVYKRLENEFYEERFQLTKQEIKDNSIAGGKSVADTLELYQEGENAEVGEYYFDIRVYDIGEKENVEKLAAQAGFKTATKFKNAFRSFQGLRVSKNGFGVKPYGEEVEDWIGLSKARVQDPGKNVNTNQILGYVYFFSPENDSLEEKTNREGFLENSAFFEVKNTLLTIFKNLGRKRYNYRALHSIGRIPTSKHSRPNFEEFLNFVKANDNLDQIRRHSERFMKEVTTSLDNLEESLSFSERLASLGSGIELVYHEMAQPISGLRTTKASLNLKVERVPFNIRENFIIDIDSLNSSTDGLAELRKSLQPAIGKSRKKKFKPYNTFIKVCGLFKSDLKEHNITPKADEKIKEYEIIDLEYALWIAFLNIINNAVYWIKKSERPGEIGLVLEGKNLVIYNSGPHIREDIIDHIFQYGVSTRQEKNATGLGLAYTQSILSTNNWGIFAENRKNGPAFILNNLKDE